MGYCLVKTEHGGAKNGGGHRGPRAEAKHQSARLRRCVDRQEEAVDWIEEQWMDFEARGFTGRRPRAQYGKVA